MTLDARVRRLEEALNAGPNQRIEQECRERMQFGVKLLVWSRFTDLSDEQRTALDTAHQVLEALPPLPKHQCAPRPRLEDDEREAIRRLVTEALKDPPSGAGSLGSDAKMKELWEWFVPSIPFPLGEQRPLDAPMP